MLILHPSTVTLDDSPLAGALAIAVSRRAKSLLTDFADTGPHPIFADVPERLTTITITRHVPEPDDSASSLALGAEVDLVFTAQRTPDAPHAMRFSARVVISSIESAMAESKALAQTISAVAISASGSADPLTIEPVSTLAHGGL